jgi:Ca2+-binding RTX toxin-like protein
MVHHEGADGGDAYDGHMLKGVDPTLVHTYSLDWASGHVGLYVDGALMWTQTRQVPQDFANGGGNAAFGVGQQPARAADLQDGDNRVDVLEVSYAAPGPGGGDPGPVERTGTRRADRLDGGAGDDTLSGRGGADVVAGSAGDDLVRGGAGDDRLAGGTGDDRLVGGTGADQFRLALGDGQDRIEDFAPGVDKLVFTGIAAGTLRQAAATRDGVAGIELGYGAADDAVFLAGLAGPLGAGDILFA